MCVCFERNFLAMGNSLEDFWSINKKYMHGFSREEDEEFIRQYEAKKVIRKSDGKWRIMNPVNPNDNLADSWNTNPEKAELFFKWVKVMKKDYVDSLQIEDNDFVALLENNFGRDYVKKSININEYANVMPTIIKNTPKPWRK